MGRTEFLNLSLRGLFHSLTDFVDLTPDHVVQLAVIPNELDVCEDFLISGILARKQLFFAGGEIHRALDNLWVVEQAHL